MTVPEEIARSRYVSLATYRRDGTAVATPVWQVVNGAELLVVTDAGTGKVKRIRNNPAVTVAVCDFRGRVAPGAARVTGTARLLDDTGTQAARALLARKYLASRLGNWVTRVLRIRRAPLVGIAVRFADS
jgi:PPOX class probable F420-dependent enzyme